MTVGSYGTLEPAADRTLKPAANGTLELAADGTLEEGSEAENSSSLSWPVRPLRPRPSKNLSMFTP